MKKRTKIICTIGPSCDSEDVLTNMVQAGMNVARLNFSHGTYENHNMLINTIRTVAQKTGEPIAIMQDLQGPKIRVGVLPDAGIALSVGESLVFDTGVHDYADGVVPVDYSELHAHVNAGERLLLDDGKLEVRVTNVTGTRIETVVVLGGTLISHKGINVPDSVMRISALTEKDKRDVAFGVEHYVDFIALSFVTSAKDIHDLRHLIKENEERLEKKPEHPIRIIAKIERHEALERIKEIVDAADGIMVARGDLGIEMSAEDVPLIQKKLTEIALHAAKPVIVATQMLDSMQKNPRPTRAEVSDVANAVIDHTDAVMLSNETAVGEYPVETVETMARIIAETEKSAYDNLSIEYNNTAAGELGDEISKMSRLLAEKVGAKLILVASLTGETGRLISRYRPELPIVVVTSTERMRHQLNLSWGVAPFVLEPCQTIEELVERSLATLKNKKMVESGDEIVVVAGDPVGHAGHINLLEVRQVV